MVIKTSIMTTNQKDIRVSEIINHLENGVTWLEKENLGFGSIQKIYGINELQVGAVRNHPKLKGLEPQVTIINVIDDTVELIVDNSPKVETVATDINEFMSAFNNL